jgi:hypothetical protein
MYTMFAAAVATAHDHLIRRTSASGSTLQGDLA